MGLGGIGGELDSVLEGARGLIGTFQIQIHLAQGLVSLRVVRIDFHGVLKLHPRVVDAVLLEVHGAEIEGGGEIRGVEFERPLEGVRRPIQITRFHLRQSQVISRQRELGIELER